METTPVQQPEPIADPRRALRLILKLCETGSLPRDAALWASSALKQTNGIFYRVRAIEQQGGAATPVHRALLLDIDTKARDWLKLRNVCWANHANSLQKKS